jgi:Domain of unknown function (DUF4836)
MVTLFTRFFVKILESMKLKQLVVLGIVASVLLTACSSKGPEYTRFIPKSSGYVVALDVKSMMTKLNEDSLTIENMLEVLKDKNNSGDYTQALEIWKQFKDAGLDFENKVLVAVPELNMENGAVSFQLVAGVKDAAKLEAFVAKLPNAPKVQKDGDLNLITLDGNVIMGWNKEAVMIVGKQSTPDYGMVDMGDTTAVATIPGAEGVKADIKKYFGLKKDESIASVKEFTDLLKETADVAVFTSSTGATGSGANPFLGMMPKVKELLDGVYSTTTLNFENGKIVINGQTYAGKKLAEILSKYAGPVADLSLVERYPSTNINGVTAFSFKPELIPAFLKETGFDAFVNMALSEGGTSVDDIAKAFKGDFAVVFSDFAMTTIEAGKDASYKRIEPTGKLVFAARIGDKASFDKLITLAEKTGSIRRVGNRLMPVIDGETGMTSEAPFGFVAGIENDLLIVSNDSVVYASYAAGKASAAMSASAKTALKDQSMSFYVNTASILKGIPDAVFDSTDNHEKNILNRSKEVFGEMYFNSTNFDGKKVTSKGEVAMASGKNALPQLVRYLMFIADEMKQKQAEEEAMYKQIESEIQGN